MFSFLLEPNSFYKAFEWQYNSVLDHEQETNVRNDTIPSLSVASGKNRRKPPETGQRRGGAPQVKKITCTMARKYGFAGDEEQIRKNESAELKAEGVRASCR